VVEVLEAAQLSVQLNRPVTLDEVREESISASELAASELAASRTRLGPRQVALDGDRQLARAVND
jgi:hypothetical protein